MSKSEFIHFDFFGNQIKLGNVVLISDGSRGKIKIAKVVKINKVMISVDPIKTINSYGRSVLRYPNDVVIIEEDIAVDYLLRNAK